MDVDSQEVTEEIILTGEDLMTGPPSPLVPSELAPKLLDGLDLCSSQLRKLFHCLHKNDIEPFCQDEILLYHRCSRSRDVALRGRIYGAEETLGRQLPEDLLQERAASLKSETDLLERRFVLASGVKGVEGFRQRWSLNGQLVDTRKRIESLERGMASKQQPAQLPSRRAWWQVW